MPLPHRGLLDGVEAVICQALGIARLTHRSALLSLCQAQAVPRGALAAAFCQVAHNWHRCRALRPGGGSSQNWRWRKPQLTIAAHNTSSEVVLERALMAACERQGRQDWSNQVPVASGVAGPHGERRRALDLVHQTGPTAFQFIELKIASDTPLYAAFEIVAYVSLWLLTRAEGRVGAGALLEADKIEAVVLAPESYYGRYQLATLQSTLTAELSELGQDHGVELSFAFEAFEDRLGGPPFADAALIQLLDQRRRL